MFPIKYIDNNLVWNKDNEVFAYYELMPYNYSFLSPEQKYLVHDSFRQLIAQSREGKIHALLSTIARTASSSLISRIMTGTCVNPARTAACFLLCPDTISYPPFFDGRTSSAVNMPCVFILSTSSFISSSSLT